MVNYFSNSFNLNKKKNDLGLYTLFGFSKQCYKRVSPQTFMLEEPFFNEQILPTTKQISPKKTKYQI